MMKTLLRFKTGIDGPTFGSALFLAYALVGLRFPNGHSFAQV